jgi:transcriptional regulator with XRE-family HTH domain
LKPAALLAARRRLGLSQKKLAALLGVARETVNRYESGALPIPRWLPLAVEGLEARAARR